VTLTKPVYIQRTSDCNRYKTLYGQALRRRDTRRRLKRFKTLTWWVETTQPKNGSFVISTALSARFQFQGLFGMPMTVCRAKLA
jgi:hypothetical protein